MTEPSRSVCRLLAVVVALGAARAAAHHSFAIYDEDNPTTIEGIVEEFRWANPHTLVKLRVPDNDGGATTWQLDYNPVNMLVRQGWTPTTLEPGDAIAIEIHPLHSGEPGGRMMGFEFLDARPSESLQGTSAITIRDIPRPDPVPMSDDEARDFNGVWFNANGGIHFDSTVAREEQDPPMKPEYLARWRQRQADAREGRATTDPTAECTPPGFPRFLSMVFPGEILQADHQINWYAEWGEATVRIYLDGREPPQDLAPSYYGFTTGHWEGNTLVTRTAGLRGDTLVDTTGVPHSEELTVTMRMRKITPDHMVVDVTLDDPVVFEEPWSTVKRYARAPGDEFVREFNCFEGNRYRIGEDGAVDVIFDDAQ